MTTTHRLAAVVALLSTGPPVRPSAAQCPDGSPPPCARLRPPLDAARYVILPFAHREGSQPAELDGADCAELLSEGFARWIDVRLADKTRIYDALERRSARTPFRIRFDTALAIARQLGAGRLVIGQLWSFGDTVRLTAGVYDAARGGPPLREASARIPPNTGHVGGVFNALADSLLGAERGRAVGAGAEQTRSLRALKAHTLGERAIRTWDVRAATRHFRSAVAADSNFAHAYLWLGQALLWAADSSPEAVRDRAAIARRAGSLLERLGPADRALLLAQEAMFERRWPDACQHYREILDADSTNFPAWYGLAECHAGDPVVIRDRTDTTRHVFRGSYEAAIRAYQRALSLAPSFNFLFGSRATERLTRLLFAEEFWWRMGQLDTVPYVAFPGLAAETLAFYPVPSAVAARQFIRPPTHRAALARNRRILVAVATDWVDAYPREPQAHRTLAYALEVAGRIAPAMGDPSSALAQLLAAQRLERRAEEGRRDAVNIVRILLKGAEFEAARRVGDSLLRATRGPAAGVAGVAVLLGRPALAARLLADADSNFLPSSADNQPVRLPLTLVKTGLALLAFASVGAPRESIAVYERRIEDAMAGLRPAERPRARSSLLDVPAQLVFDAMGLRPTHRPTPPGPAWAMEMQWALAHGDTAVVRHGLETVLTVRGGAPTAEESSPDGVYLTSRLMLALGDTLAAERYVDGTLESMSGLYSALLDYMPLAGALVRTMTLRADLAAARGDSMTARRWANAVVALWSGAEPALQPTAARMRRISQTGR